MSHADKGLPACWPPPGKRMAEGSCSIPPRPSPLRWLFGSRQPVPATVVDHIVPAEGNQLRFWDQGNWQPCCAWHHNSIKASLEKMWRKREIKVEALSLASREAIALTKRRMKVQIGLDGWPIE